MNSANVLFNMETLSLRVVLKIQITLLVVQYTKNVYIFEMAVVYSVKCSLTAPGGFACIPTAGRG